LEYKIREYFASPITKFASRLRQSAISFNFSLVSFSNGSGKCLTTSIPSNNSVVAFSLFQLPKEYDTRNNIYKNILMQEGELHFALEDLSIITSIDIKRIEDIWMVRQTLSECPTKIRNTEE
jgi:hypothetical protein|tara:strand:+ start:76 stop:441 length:366 start_codon:yes stop_codon:yes gene_type:complete